MVFVHQILNSLNADGFGSQLFSLHRDEDQVGCFQCHRKQQLSSGVFQQNVRFADWLATRFQTSEMVNEFQFILYFV